MSSTLYSRLTYLIVRFLVNVAIHDQPISVPFIFRRFTLTTPNFYT